MSENILNFTDKAIAHITKSLTRFPDGGFRLSVKKAGCTGYKYVPEIIPQPKVGDLHFTTEQGLRVYVDPQCLNFVKGTIVDLESKSLGHKQLVFNNPNVTGACGCGESFHLNEDQHG